MEFMMEVVAALAAVNAVVLIGLIYMYLRLAVRTRAMYSVGLLVFALLLLSHNLLAVFAYVTMAPFFGVEALPVLSVVSAFELAGLLVLLKITL